MINFKCLLYSLISLLFIVSMSPNVLADDAFQDVYLLLDVSDSASAWGSNNETIFSNIKETAINIIENDYFKEANITYFTIGNQSRNDTGEFYFVGNPNEAQKLKDEIGNLKTGSGYTDLVYTFDNVIPVMENRSNNTLVIIISDGNLVNQRTYNDLLHAVNLADKHNATMLFINLYTVGSTRPEQFNDSRGNIYAKSLMRNYKGDGVYVESSQGLPIDPNFPQMFGVVETVSGNITASTDLTTPSISYTNSSKPGILNSGNRSLDGINNNLIYIFMTAVVLIMLFILYELHLLRKRREN